MKNTNKRQNKVSSETSESMKKPKDSIIYLGREFPILLKSLTLFGICPLSRDSSSRRFFFVPICSCRGIFNIMLSLLNTLTWIAYMMDVLFHKLWIFQTFRGPLTSMETYIAEDKDLNPAVGKALLYLIKTVFFIFPLSQFQEMVFGWTQAKYLSRFLNNWLDFEKEFEDCFSSSLNKELSLKYQKLWKIGPFTLRTRELVLVGPIIISTIMMGFISSNFWDANKPWNILYIWYFGARLTIFELLVDFKNLSMFENIIEAFWKIKMGIMNSEDKCEKCFTEVQIKGWRQLIERVRSQVELAGKYQKPSQLYFIGRSIVLITIFAFAIVNLPWDNARTIRFSILWACFSAVQIIRLYLKCRTAEQVTSQEMELAKVLTKIDTSKSPDSSALLQIKFTYDLVAQNYAKINLGNYVILNKKVLIHVFNQVVTYLIVMMQFIQNK